MNIIIFLHFYKTNLRLIMQQYLLSNNNRIPGSQTSPRAKPLIRAYYKKNDICDQIREFNKLRIRTCRQFEFSQSDGIRFTRNAAEILRTQDNPKTLDYVLDNQRQFQHVYFADQLKKNSCTLSSLSLQTTELTKQIRHFPAFLKNITSLKNLSQIQFQFYTDNRRPLKIPAKFFKSLRYFKKLARLSFFLSRRDSTPLSNEINIFSHLSKLTRLHYLRVEIHSDLNSDSENLLNMLSSVLPKLSNLSQIELILPNRAIQTPTLIQLFRSFFAIKNLSHITLDLASLTISTLAEGLAYLDPSKIRKLDINLRFHAGSPNLGKLAKALKRFSSLQILRLKFWDMDEIPQEDLEGFSSALSSLVSLTSLSLESSSEFLIESIAPALESLKNLNLLRIESKIYATKDQIQQLFSNLKGLNCLQFLHLSLERQPEIDDFALEILTYSLKRLGSLKKLHLNFGANDEITSKGVESICDVIKRLPNLSSLTLSFAQNPNIDEEAVYEIFKALGTLPSLYDVIVCLYKCRKLKARENDLRKSFDVLRKVEKFIEGELDISCCKLDILGAEDDSNLFDP